MPIRVALRHTSSLAFLNVRYVDSSLARVQVQVRGMIEGHHTAGMFVPPMACVAPESRLTLDLRRA